MIEEYDEIREVTNPAKKEDLSELTKLQTEYLKELNQMFGKVCLKKHNPNN